MVDTTLLVFDIVSVDEINFSLSVYAALGIGWFESRLEYNGTQLQERDSKGISVDPAFIQLV